MLAQQAHEGLVYAQLLALHVNAVHEEFGTRGGQPLQRGRLHCKLQSRRSLVSAFRRVRSAEHRL